MKAPQSEITVQPDPRAASPTAGIQEAIDALPEGGGRVWLQAGVYPVRHSIRLRSNVTLSGSGAATVLQRPAPILFTLTTDMPAHSMDAGLSSTDGLQPGDELYITDRSQHGWHARHITIESMAGTRIQGSRVSGPPERTYQTILGAWGGNFFPMILIPEGKDVTVIDLQIDGGDAVFPTDFFADFTCSAVHGCGVDALRVRGVLVRRWPSDGISAQRGSAVVSECIVEDGLGHGYHPGSGIGQSIWTGNISRRNRGDGFYFCQGVRHAVVAQNLFLDNGQSGIGGLTAPDAYNVITGNVIAGNGDSGIDGVEALGNVIVGNLVRNNSRRATGERAGIELLAHADNVVAGNLCLDTEDSPSQTRDIEDSAPAGTNLVEGNIGSLHRREWPALPRGRITRASTTPALDGKLSASVWRVADGLAVDRLHPRGTLCAIDTRAYLLWDDRHIYVGVHCPEPLMERVRDRITAHGGPVYAENCVDVFLQPCTGDPRVYRISVNTLGALFEASYEGRSMQPWQARVRAATFRADAHWSLELAVPLASLGLEVLQAGQTIRGNICRTRRSISPPQYTCWSPTRTGFQDPKCFGTLTLTHTDSG